MCESNIMLHANYTSLKNNTGDRFLRLRGSKGLERHENKAEKAFLIKKSVLFLRVILKRLYRAKSLW